MTQVLNDTRPVARKVYYCSWCGTKIQPGTKYRRLALIGDDGFYEWIECLDCTPLVSPAYDWAGGCWSDGITEDDLSEWAQENVDDPTWGDAAQAFLERRRRARLAEVNP